MYLFNDFILEFKLEHKFSFVIMIAGFVSDYQKSLLNSTVNMKSLIAIGENDNIIPKGMPSISLTSHSVC